jgi:hypothetical protein
MRGVYGGRNWICGLSVDPRHVQLRLMSEDEVRTGLDPGIADAVMILREAGFATYESCQGGPGHAFPEPTVRFGGSKAEGFKAYAVAIEMGLPVVALKRVWRVSDSELEGPWWEMTLIPTTAWWPT